MSDVSPAYQLGRFVFELDRMADHLLQTRIGITYRRFLFLTVLQHAGTVTQHELARALGYSDPAVSAMLVELAAAGHVHTSRSPEHGRKRLVTITQQGSDLVARGRSLLDAHFDQLLALADVDVQQLRDITERLYRALASKRKAETA